MKYNKILVPGLSLVLLNGCLSVDDDSNAEVARAIEAQTKVIESQQQVNTVTFTGVVVNALDNEAVTSAFVTVMVGSEMVADKVVATNGKFEIAKLPPDSDITVIITSEDNKYLQRVFFLNTGNSTSGAAVKDFGTFAVSEPLEAQITVLDQATGLPFDKLSFYADSSLNINSNFRSHSGREKYRQTSSYDEVNGTYKITVPKYISTSALASLDITKNGKIDYLPESANNLFDGKLVIKNINSFETATVYIKEVTVPEIVDVEYKLSLVDVSSNPITGAEFYVEDTNNLRTKSSFDATTGQYSLNAKFENSIYLTMPAFTSNGVNYQSLSIRLAKLTNTDELQVQISGAANTNPYFTIPNSKSIDLAVQPREINNSSDLEVILKSSEVNSTDDSFSVFYSQPVAISAESATLTRTNGFSVIRGNDSTEDAVLPGTTVIRGSVNIPVTTELSLNDTKLKVKPTTAPLAFGSYRYEVGDITIKQDNSIVNLNDDYLNFSTSSSSEIFNINDIHLDNGSYTTNGTAIISQNTAGILSTPSNFNNSVYFYLPTSITSLKSLNLRQVSVVADGIARNSFYDYVIVSNGQVNYNVNSVGVISVAQNENVVRDNINITLRLGTAQPESQYVYSRSAREYMSDNLTGSANTITYEYAYETKAGEVETGTITIPVQ